MNHIWIIERINKAGAWIPTSETSYTRAKARDKMKAAKFFGILQYRVVKYVSARRPNHCKKPAW